MFLMERKAGKCALYQSRRENPREAKLFVTFDKEEEAGDFWDDLHNPEKDGDPWVYLNYRWYLYALDDGSAVWPERCLVGQKRVGGCVSYFLEFTDWILTPKRKSLPNSLFQRDYPC